MKAAKMSFFVLVMLTSVAFIMYALHNLTVDANGFLCIHNIKNAQLNTPSIFDNINESTEKINSLSRYTKENKPFNRDSFIYGNGSDSKIKEILNFARDATEKYHANYIAHYNSVINDIDIKNIQNFSDATDTLWEGTKSEDNPWSVVFGDNKEDAESQYSYVKKQLNDRIATLKEMNMTVHEEVTPQEMPLSELDIVKNDHSPLGNMGRLYIPSVGISVRLNQSSAPYMTQQYYQDNQYYTDMQDSANYGRIGVEHHIADHYYQGFYKINNVRVGTKLYIKNLDGSISTYVCTSAGDGLNDNGRLRYNGQDGDKINAGGLFVYTCHGYDSYNITVRLFQLC